MSETKHKKLIIFISIFLPLAVAALFGINLQKLGFDVAPLSFLPPIYAGINGLTAIVLVAAVLAIKKGNRKLHEGLMKTCIGLSILCLLMYIAYHMTSNSTLFGDLNHDGVLAPEESLLIGSVKYFYYSILLSHIVLSVAIIPLVLITYSKTLAQQFDQHKKIAKITFPIWLYVAVTGVVVFWMISPYYG
jgi:putative membrane protein